MNKEMLIRSIIILIMLFVVSIVLVKTFTGGHTIAEYAIENNIPHHTEKTE